MRAYEIRDASGVDGLTCVERADVAPGLGEVAVAIKASSINYRDLTTIEDPIPRGIVFPRVPNSCGAGEVIALGEEVDGLAVGDSVSSCFFQDWTDGSISAAGMASALGGPIDGVLSEQVILKASGVIRAPSGLNHAQTATLPCAALTAWHAMAEFGQGLAGQTVLLLGTGGVSIFALQFAKVMGMRAIITSSSDAKLARARELGAWATINYRTTPQWQDQVLELTGGVGVDLTVEVGGAGTLERSVAATRVAGRIALIGVLTGGQINPALIMRKSIHLKGIYVGSRAMFGRMNAAIETHGIQPVIDQTFDFEDARSAYHAMRAAGHFGKLVVALER